jgi:uncharacterized membrane protein YfcA
VYLTPALVPVVLLVGAGTGVLGALLGTGGGVLLVPFLVLALGVPMHYAIATSIVSVIATSSAVASSNVERGTANMRLGMTLEVATALGALTGAFTAGLVSPRTLEGLFAAVLLPVALLMWIGRASDGADDTPTPAPTDPGLLGGRYVDETDGYEVVYRVKRVPAGLGISFLAGNLSGLLGIGGGIFKVPALALLCGVPIRAAAATSNFMIGVTAAASAFLYHGRGEIRPALTATAVLGVLIGSVLGARLNRRVKAGALKRLFAVLLLAVAVQMFYRVASGVAR